MSSAPLPQPVAVQPEGAAGGGGGGGGAGFAVPGKGSITELMVSKVRSWPESWAMVLPKPSVTMAEISPVCAMAAPAIPKNAMAVNTIRRQYAVLFIDSSLYAFHGPRPRLRVRSSKRR